MTITVPKLKKHKPILVAQSIRMHYPKQWTWQDHLQELELQYNDWVKTYTTKEINMKDVNEVMQVLYPGPYRVVEKYLTDRMIFGFSLVFDDPHEELVWLLKNS
jgi:hypothetical protein